MNHAQYDQETGSRWISRILNADFPMICRLLFRRCKSWAIIDSGSRDPHWDIYWCNLNADINSAEVERIISPEQAWYLREKYLRMERE
mgnify:CR=1 FL=1